MRKIIVSLFILSLLLVLFGCSYNEGVVLTDKPAYLQFLGDASDVEITLDNIRLDLSGHRKDISKNLFQYKEGYHTVEIRRGEALILRKIVLLEKGKTTQVMIP